MNSNKIPMEIAALDSEKISAGLTNTNLSEAQIIAATLFRMKGIIPSEINCRTVTLSVSPEAIDHIRQSLGDIGLKEVVRGGVEKRA
jgi:hypothetical protein